MAVHRIAVLGAPGGSAERRLRDELDRALSGTGGEVALVRSDRPASGEDDWVEALGRIDASDVVVVVLSTATIGDPVWRALVDRSTAVRAGLVLLVAEDVTLSTWPIALRDARPAMVVVGDPGWLTTLAELAGTARPERPAGWTAPARPPSPQDPITTAPSRTPASQPGPAQPVATEPAPIDEDVQFTLYRPAAVAPRRWHWLLLFAHKAQAGPELADPLAEVRRQAAGILGDDADDYGALTADSTGSLRRGTTLLIEPWLDGATFNPPTVELQWNEPLHRADFRFRVAEGTPATARGGVRIFAGVVLIGELTMTVRVGPGEDATAPPQRADRFRRIFASYAHEDTAVVEQLAAAVAVLGDEYLIDTRSLRSGDDWAREIEGFIEEADVFQLFWSGNALRSPHVLDECRHALSLGREGFIRPVYWEDPFPQDPDHDLPPAPIRRLHFSRLHQQPDDRSAAAPPPPPASPPAAASATAASPPPPSPPPPVAAPGGRPPAPARPSTAAPPSRTPHRRRIPWAALAAVAVIGAGAGAFALQDRGGDEAAEPATSIDSPDTEPPTPTSTPGVDTTVIPPTTGEIPTETLPTTIPNTVCGPADCLRGAFPVMDGADCQPADLLPALESYAELCLLEASAGAPIRFRGAVTAEGLDVAGYLQQLGRRTGAQIEGEGRWSRDGVEVGPYVDFTWTAPEDPTPACRAWGEDGDELVGWVCAADRETALAFWEGIVG